MASRVTVSDGVAADVGPLPAHEATRATRTVEQDQEERRKNQQQSDDYFGAAAEAPRFGFDPWTLALRDELLSGRCEILHTLDVQSTRVEILAGSQSVWVIGGWENGSIAHRAAHSPGDNLKVNDFSSNGASFRMAVQTSHGEMKLDIEFPLANLALLRCTATLKPYADLVIPFWPRDIYPLTRERDPLRTAGVVHATQQGATTGTLYLSLTRPRGGSLLYIQNFTSLNRLFDLTHTDPDTCVGGLWPQLGFALPGSVDRPMPADEETVVSDAFLRFTNEIPQNAREASDLYLKMLGDIYPHLEQPQTIYHDWIGKARQTLRDLRSPKAIVRRNSKIYLHPYTEAEHPDSMCQFTVALAVRDYEKWAGRQIKLDEQLIDAGMAFYDKEIGAVRRYLPGKLEDKDPDEVDSWYLYHPLANLGRLAVEGHHDAEKVFLGSLDHAIRAAHHFEYRWPVKFDIRTLETKEATRAEGEGGQTDVPGLYAYVMLQAYDLTGDERYINEAKAAAESIKSLSFSAGYQFNNTAWGANAFYRLWQLTGTHFYRDQSHVLLASFFHHTALWEPDFGPGKHYQTFMAVSCLNTAEYIAMYECYESYAALLEYAKLANGDLQGAVSMLIAEYCRFFLSRAWFYYPQELPDEIISKDVRSSNGHIDRNLAFPLEDLYLDWNSPGQVGQEIYGAGAALAAVSRAYHRIEGEPLLVYCDYPIGGLETGVDGRVYFQIYGDRRFRCNIRLIPTGRVRISSASLEADIAGSVQKFDCRTTAEGHKMFEAPGDCVVALSWETGRTGRKDR